MVTELEICIMKNLQSVYCKIKVPKVAKQKWTLLHVQNGQNCKVLYQRALRNGVAPER